MLKTTMLAAVVLVASAALVAFSMSSAMAAQADDTMEVTATVVTQCELDAPDLDFGEYTGGEINKDSVWSLQCTTSETTITSWAWTGGLHYANGSQNMADANGNLLAYHHTTFEPWNPTDAAGQTSFTLHMQLFGGQIVPAGAYADTMTVYANF